MSTFSDNSASGMDEACPEAAGFAFVEIPMDDDDSPMIFVPTAIPVSAGSAAAKAPGGKNATASGAGTRSTGRLAFCVVAFVIGFLAMTCDSDGHPDDRPYLRGMPGNSLESNIAGPCRRCRSFEITDDQGRTHRKFACVGDPEYYVLVEKQRLGSKTGFGDRPDDPGAADASKKDLDESTEGLVASLSKHPEAQSNPEEVGPGKGDVGRKRDADAAKFLSLPAGGTREGNEMEGSMRPEDGDDEGVGHVSIVEGISDGEMNQAKYDEIEQWAEEKEDGVVPGLP